MTSLPQLRRLRWAVRATLVLGVAASVVANILHAVDDPISRTIAAWPPFALLLTVELISRVPVHRRSLAFLRLVATAAIAGIAAWISYWHMAGVAAKYGETGGSEYLLPISVDGLIVVASICLIELGGRIAAAQAAERAAAEAAPVAAPAPGEPASVIAETAPAEEPRGLPWSGDTPADRADAEVIAAAQPPRAESRTEQEIETAIRALAAVQPPLSRRAIARAAGVSDHKVRAVLGPVGKRTDEQLEVVAGPPVETVAAEVTELLRRRRADELRADRTEALAGAQP